MKQAYIYILASKNNNVVYIGVTSNLILRIYQHKQGLVDGFTKKYHVHKLVYYESIDSIEEAIQREKRLKKWNREWKNNLISTFNPDWIDIYYSLIG